MPKTWNALYVASDNPMIRYINKELDDNEEVEEIQKSENREIAP